MMNKEIKLDELLNLLLILLTGLKLAGVITWPWIWILYIIWISALLAVVLMFCSLLFNSIANYFSKKDNS
jgi:hypothetical protein